MATRHSEWLDAQYNNRARVPAHSQIFVRWQDASAAARDRLLRRLDVAYGASPGETLDIFPAARSNAPVLVFIHGGWWRSLDKRDHSFIAPPFVDAGAMVVVPNYALCPAVSIETVALQMTRALAWTHRHAALYGGDAKRIVVAGHSAGGHLAAMLLCCDWKAVGRDLPAQLVRHALAISGVFDLAPISQVSFLKDDLQLTPPAVRKLSPVRFPRPRGFLHATAGALESEEFMRQRRLIRTAWGARAVPPCEPVAGADHFTVLDDLAAPHGALHGLARRLLGL